MPRYNSFFATSCCSIAVCDLLHCYFCCSCCSSGSLVAIGLFLPGKKKQQNKPKGNLKAKRARNNTGLLSFVSVLVTHLLVVPGVEPNPGPTVKVTLEHSKVDSRYISVVTCLLNILVEGQSNLRYYLGNTLHHFPYTCCTQSSPGILIINMSYLLH